MALETEEGKQDKSDLLLDLNFVPTWARKPPGVNPYLVEDKRERAGRRPERGPRKRRPPSDRGRKREDRRPHPPRRPAPRREAPRAPVEDLPIDVSFIPERKRIGAVVREVHASGRAYPLLDLAALFLSKPPYYLVKLEVRKKGPEKTDLAFFQCKHCKTLFLDRQELWAHALADHLDEYYDVEDTEVDPPAGNFVCVGRCRLSGVLVGPPNYHGFNEKVHELHQARFSHMPLEQYRNQIEMLHEPEAIEKWKDQSRKKKIYRARGKDASTSPEMSWNEVEAHFHSHFASRVGTKTARVIVPSHVTHNLQDGSLKHLVREAWTRESRYALTLSLALRPAFRHMRLHLFKANRGATFVTAIRPHPIDPQRAISSIREVLQFLRDHPGCTRQKLVESLRPDAAPDSSEVAAVLSPLRWLIERGHVVEFFNGTLSVPSAPRRKR